MPTISNAKSAAYQIALILCLSSNVIAESYKCTIGNRTEFSDQPCAQPSKPNQRLVNKTSERELTVAEIQAQFERDVAEERKKKEAARAQESITNEHVCKAGIAKIMGRDPKSIKVTKTDGPIVYLQYIRASDNSLWSNRCRVDGSKLLWASEPGRWREDPRDEKVTVSVINNTVTIKETYADGSSTQKTFEALQLK